MPLEGAHSAQSFLNELEKQLHMIQSHTGNDQQLFALLAAAAAAAQQSAGRQQRTPTKSPEERNACEICDKEFDSKLNLLQHQLLQHAGGGNAAQQDLFGNLLPPMHLPFLPQQTASLAAAELAAQLGVANMGASSPIKQQQQAPQQQPKRQYSRRRSTEHSTFRCDKCMIEMKSRQALRDHKREGHGVQPLMTPTSGGGGSGSNSQARTPKFATFPADGTPSGENAFFGSAIYFLANSVAAQSRSGSQTPPELAASGGLLAKPENEELNTLENNERSTAAQVTITCNSCAQNFSNELQKQLHSL
ncbi:hypothetical protein AAVH_25178 [Aphelenchoides avenae]|nr:hypothetical protein AAVH_25178 [Aphelenchus avenae]